MALPNIFSKTVTENLIQRINNLTAATAPKWGEMGVAKMLAHCNVTYEMAYENTLKKPNAFMRLILKKLIKPKVVSEYAYLQNGQTAPQFIIKDAKKFDTEKIRLVNYLNKTHQLGETYFEEKESPSFGA